MSGAAQDNGSGATAGQRAHGTEEKEQHKYDAKVNYLEEGMCDEGHFHHCFLFPFKKTNKKNY